MLSHGTVCSSDVPLLFWALADNTTKCSKSNRSDFAPPTLLLRFGHKHANSQTAIRAVLSEKERLVVFPDYRTAFMTSVYHPKSQNQQIVLRFVVLVHFVVFLDLWFARFRKTRGVGIFGCLLFLANSPFCAAICGGK